MILDYRLGGGLVSRSSKKAIVTLVVGLMVREAMKIEISTDYKANTGRIQVKTDAHGQQRRT